MFFFVYVILCKIFGTFKIWEHCDLYNYEFTRHVKYRQKNTDKQNYTIARYQYTESTWEYVKKKKLLIKFRFTDLI